MWDSIISVQIQRGNSSNITVALTSSWSHRGKKKITILNSRPAVPEECHIRKRFPWSMKLCGLVKGDELKPLQRKLQWEDDWNFHCSVRGHQWMRQTVCEPSFVEGLPTQLKGGKSGPLRRSIKGIVSILHWWSQGNGKSINVASPPPKFSLKV